jgi:hypothetical protein
MKNNLYYAGDKNISQDEYKVIVASSGKFNLQQAANYCGFTNEQFIKISKDLQDKLALAFCKY